MLSGISQVSPIVLLVSFSVLIMLALQHFISTLHLLLPRQIGFWASLVSPLNVLMLIPYLDFTKLWYAQLLNMPIQFGVPFYIGDQRMLEKVQKHATRLIPSLRDLPYSE